MSPFSSFNLFTTEKKNIHDTENRESSKISQEYMSSCYIQTRVRLCGTESHQFPGQSVGVAGFLGVFTATRILLFAVSRASHTNPTEDTSLLTHGFSGKGP